MVDVKTEPEAACANSASIAATSTTTTTTESEATTTTTSAASDAEQSDKKVDFKIKVDQTSEHSPNDNNNNNNGEHEADDDDDDDAEFDEEEETSNHRNGGTVALYSKDNDEKTNLIVNYLPQQMTDEEFEELFKKFGTMKSCKIVRNRQTGYSYGFGFVDFETHDQALAAIDQLNGQEVDTKKIKVAFARPAGQDIKQANLYVKNVPTSWSQDDVRKVFEPYGSIIQVRVLGNNRGVAFVLFDLRKQAQDALDALNGKQVDGCEAPFEIKFAAEKKGEKQRGSRGGSGRNRRGGNRGGNFNRNNQNQSNNFNSNNNNNNNNNNRNNRSNSSNRRGTSQNRGGNMYNNNNNNSNYGGNMNGGVGPMRQQQTNRSNRFSPFVQMQPPQQTAPMTPYGYAQQPMLPYVMQGPSVMQGAPVMQGPSVMQMSNAPVNPYSMAAPMGPIGYVQPPMAQPSAAMTNMYNVASTTMNNAAQMQPQLGQPMNMRGNSGASSGGGGGGGGHNDGVTLFVYNIGPDCDETELKEMFTPYGAVTRCNVVRKTPGGETKGFGFVTLRSRDHANAAIAGLNNTMRNGRSLQVSFKK